MSDPFEGAGVTALGLAAARAVESSRPDRLIDDPHARRLFEAAGRDLPMRLEWPGDDAVVTGAEALHLHGSRYIGLRTRFYDDAVLAAGADQVVLLGAGLDTRALRLDVPAAVFELDAPGVLDYKAEVLPPAGPGLRRVGTDMAGAWVADLLAAGFDPGLSTVWVAEGLMPYLPAQAQLALISAVADNSRAAAGFVFDQVAGGDVAGLSERSGIDMSSLLTGTDGAGHLTRALADHGWKCRELDVPALAAEHGRDLADPFGTGSADPPWLDTVFVQASRLSADSAAL